MCAEIQISLGYTFSNMFSFFFFVWFELRRNKYLLYLNEYLKNKLI